MNKSLIMAGAIAAALFAGGGASAADLIPMKAAPPLQRSNAFDTSGYYFGVWGQVGAGAADANVPTLGAVGLTQTWGAIGGLVGYNWAPAAGGQSFFVEAALGYKNLNGTANNTGLSVFGGPLVVDITGAITVPADVIARFIPITLPSGPAFPANPLPGGATAKNMHMYIGPTLHLYDDSAAFGVAQNKEWIIQPGAKVGMLTQYSDNSVVDVGLSFLAQNNSVCVGPAMCVKPGNTVLGTLAVKF